MPVPSGFYQDMKPVPGFSNIFDPRHRRPAPEEWFVVVADVKDSTQAVHAGHYKNVNIVGAACIVSVLKRLGDKNVPFVFGGDGASFLIPAEWMKDAARALAQIRSVANLAFDLDLRLGAVPVREIYARGKTLDISKYALPGNMEIAMFHGGGLKEAENMVKSGQGDGRYTLDDWIKGEPVEEPDLSGLECRWNPVAARRGKMMTLIILSRKGEKTYQDALDKIKNLVGTENEYRPVAAERLSLSMKPQNLAGEYTFKTAGVGAGISKRTGLVLRMALENLLAKFLFATGARIGSFDGRSYRNDLVANCDFQKFDDTLRLVLDASDAQIAELQEYLEKSYAQGDLFYGANISDHATMTCLIFERSDRHLHFIDGAEGGYTLAARRMKDQMQAALPGNDP